MLLQLNYEWVQVALRVSENDGPNKGDLSLLKTLVSNDIVYKRAFEHLQMGYPEYPTARDHFIPLATRIKSSVMLGVLKMTANLRIDTGEQIPPENTPHRMPKRPQNNVSSVRKMLGDSCRSNESQTEFDVSHQKAGHSKMGLLEIPETNSKQDETELSSHGTLSQFSDSKRD